ncbi:hypothetical protein J5N97_002173 [Dioscorea zingiberensis]|uniref:Uncharacterized protein n=1 Tax=Dioscorea zingiberensis TaxID=325984 RepID=A0A9D5D3V8_9LILI|nr:hypothetical protein J5N97_002173 [Dioscorea zingiberensis]
MAITLDGIGRTRLDRGIGCFPACPVPEITGEGPAVRESVPVEVDERCSSSIGRNSDSSWLDGESSPEVESRLKGSLETMDVLEESLPFRQGTLKFYCGKSKSFTSLADAASSASSAKNHTKPENAHTRKRKNILDFTDVWGKLDNYSPHNMGGGTPKKPTNSSRSTTSQNPSASSSGSNDSDDIELCQLLGSCHPTGELTATPGDTPPLSSPSPTNLPFSMRSFPVTDLQAIARSSPLS